MNATETPARYYDTLALKQREALFQVMRDLDSEEQRYRSRAQALAAPAGTIGVGAADFDEIIKAEVLLSYLRALRQGRTPEEAYRITETERTECVRKFNQRIRDHVLMRWEGTEQALIDRIHQQALKAAA